MATLFNYLADHGMEDSPDGPAAEEMRTMAARSELTGEQLKKVVGTANEQVALHSAILEQEAERRRSRSILVGFVLATADDLPASLNKVDQQFPLPDDSTLEVAQAAVDVVSLLGSHVQLELTPPTQ